ncbi:MAG TPA: GNAT family N-acetyltransferase [Micromonosporaceae bacterium]|nr:GNAT family N-acetyltransferase [Micromonosporaceae bacterium]
MTVDPSDLLVLLERFYDAVPRDRARAERHGELELFVPDTSPWPFYARPRLGGGMPTAADIAVVRARQRELALPEALEWVDETTPGLIEVAEAAGLAVLRAPLMVLDPHALPAVPAGVRVLDPDAPSFGSDVAVREAVARVGFRAPGTATGAAGAAARDAALEALSEGRIRRDAARIRAGRAAQAVAETPDQGAVASGLYQRVAGVAEIVGVATLPAARRRGLGAAVTVALARHALDHGATTVFLSAAEEDVARVYARVGFRRVGTACIAEPA